jgi:hypothetical protein
MIKRAHQQTLHSCREYHNTITHSSSRTQNRQRQQTTGDRETNCGLQDDTFRKETTQEILSPLNLEGSCFFTQSIGKDNEDVAAMPSRSERCASMSPPLAAMRIPPPKPRVANRPRTVGTPHNSPLSYHHAAQATLTIEHHLSQDHHQSTATPTDQGHHRPDIHMGSPCPSPKEDELFVWGQPPTSPCPTSSHTVRMHMR